MLTEHILGRSSRSWPISRACGMCLLEAAHREVHPGWWVSSHKWVMFSWVVNHWLLHRSVFWNPFLLPLKLQRWDHTDNAHGYLHHNHLMLSIICEAGVLNPNYSYIGNTFAVHNITSMSRQELKTLKKGSSLGTCSPCIAVFVLGWFLQLLGGGLQTTILLLPWVLQ